MKSTKYDHDPRSLRAAAAGMRRLGSGTPPLNRFRLGLEFALSGHREVEDMISHHARMTRTLGEHLGLPEDVLEALGAAYEQWDGRGWPGELEGAEVPLAARLALEVADPGVLTRVGQLLVDVAERVDDRNLRISMPDLTE